ncbi:hypothetical protein BPOR_0373g00020 [Botrytis porri]|uniref:Uncharacterized protein n=1 Tax=Botrytis porri TaxID=87229 RepID=A0A4Z1KHV8_9HELO|nr:hypothetical protein BPOR_0373g00020 [Botrytis porri]
MKFRILMKMMSTIILVAHSVIAYKENEYSLATPRMVVRCNAGEFISPEEVGSALDGMSKLFGGGVGTPLMSFNIGKNLNRLEKWEVLPHQQPGDRKSDGGNQQSLWR